MSLGQIIRQQREELGMTQDAVVNRARISKPYLSNIETGKTKNPPSDDVLHRLERALGFRKDELVWMAHLDRTPQDVRDQIERLQTENHKLRDVVAKVTEQAPRNTDGTIDLNALAEEIEFDSNVADFDAGSLVPVINKVTAGYPQEFMDLDYPTGIADEYIRVPDVEDAQAFAARVVGDSMEPKYEEGNIVVFSPNRLPNGGDDCFVRFADYQGCTFKRYYQDDQEIRLQPLNSAYPSQTYAPEAITGLWPAVYRLERLRGR